MLIILISTFDSCINIQVAIEVNRAYSHDFQSLVRQKKSYKTTYKKLKKKLNIVDKIL